MLKVGDTVIFSRAVVARCNHDARIARMRGRIVAIEGHCAQIDTGNTLRNEAGESIRTIPLANLVRRPELP